MIKFAGTNLQINAGLRFAVYCTEVAYGGETKFNFFWNKFQHESGNPSERLNLLTALSCSKDEASMKVML